MFHENLRGPKNRLVSFRIKCKEFVLSLPVVILGSRKDHFRRAKKVENHKSIYFIHQPSGNKMLVFYGKSASRKLIFQICIFMQLKAYSSQQICQQNVFS